MDEEAFEKREDVEEDERGWEGLKGGETEMKDSKSDGGEFRTPGGRGRGPLRRVFSRE